MINALAHATEVCATALGRNLSDESQPRTTSPSLLLAERQLLPATRASLGAKA